MCSLIKLRVCLVARMGWDGIGPSHPRWCLVYGSGELGWTQKGIFSQYAGWDGSTKSVGRGGSGRTRMLAHRTHRGRTAVHAGRLSPFPVPLAKQDPSGAAAAAAGAWRAVASGGAGARADGR